MLAIISFLLLLNDDLVFVVNANLLCTFQPQTNSEAREVITAVDSPPQWIETGLIPDATSTRVGIQLKINDRTIFILWY